MQILEKVRNIIKNKFNKELIYCKKYLKAEKKTHTKGGLNCLYATIILIDSIYKKDENYYPEVFSEKTLFY